MSHMRPWVWLSSWRQRADWTPRCRIKKAALRRAQTVGDRAVPKEAGGIVLGYRDGDEIVVTEMLEVTDVRATGSAYHRNHSDAEGVLAAARCNQAPDSPVGYVGEWHSHPLPAHASATDKRELDRIGSRAKGPVVLIVLVRHPDEWRAEVRVSNGRQQKSVEFLVY